MAKIRAELGILRALVKSFYQEGLLSDEDLADDKKTFKKISDLLDQQELEIVVNHQDGLLLEAVRQFEASHYEYSLVFYSTFFEHTVNSIINGCRRDTKLTHPEMIQVIKAIKMEDKVTWLFKLLGIHALQDKHRQIILGVCSKRNEFVHYKFKPVATDAKDDNREIRKLLESARSTATYLKRFEAKVLYKGKKKRLEDII